MNGKVILATIVAGGTMLFATASPAEAHWGRKNGWMREGHAEIHQQMLQKKADFLGLSLDQLKDELDDKSFLQLAREKGKSMTEVRQVLLTLWDERYQMMKQKFEQNFESRWNANQ